MAAEFSRELSEKVLRGKTHIVQLGFWVGGQAGYGYRRLMLSPEGRPRLLMQSGENKSLTTDRVVLVPGPLKEQQGIREMFAMAIKRMGCTDIARELNRRGFAKEGKPWTNATVYNAVTNPKYAGNNVWRRTTSKLRSPRLPVPPQQWIRKVSAFEPLVDQQTFDLAQTRLPTIEDYRWTSDQIVKRARKLLEEKGRISEGLILQARNMPRPCTIKGHFGSLREFYRVLGYNGGEHDIYRGEQIERSLRLRRELVCQIRDLFPGHVELTRVPQGTRSMLRIDGKFLVSVYLCRTKYRKKGGLHWVVEPSPLEHGYITLFCKMSPAHDRVLSYYLFPEMNFKSHKSHDNDPWLGTAVCLKNLSDLYLSATRLWSEKSPRQGTLFGV